MHTDPTVLVLGGGPSGMAIAIAMAHAGLSVAVVERTHYETPRVGEALPPAAKPLLQRLGVWDAFCQDAHLHSPGVVSAWGEGDPFESDFYFNPYGFGWHLDRQKFDSRLAATAEAMRTHVHRDAHVVDFARTLTGWRVEIQFAEQRVRFQPQFLVDATGRSSWLARRLGSHRVICDRLVGVVATIECNDCNAHDRRLLLEATEYGWWYSIILPNNTMIVTYMTDAEFLAESRHDLRAFWRQRLQSTRYTRERLADETPPVSVRTVSANSYRMDSVAGDGWLAIGDAAMAWDPLSSQGIMKALGDGLSGAAAVRSALKGDSSALQSYSQNVAKAFDGFRSNRDYFYGMERRWPASGFWQRRQSL